MQKEKIIGIYKITSPSNRIYIGQSINLDKRINKYKKFKCKSQPKIYRSLNKYGFDAHKIEIIEKCPIEKLNERETFWKIYYLEQVNNDWQQVLFCDLYDLGGGPKSEETRRKIGEGNKGKTMSDEAKSKIGEANTGNKYNVGRKDSEEVNLKRSISLKETRKHKKWACGQKKGYIMSEAQRISLRVPCSESAKQNMRGKPKSEQGKLNMCVPKPNSQIPVNQLDLDGNFIKLFPSVTDVYLFFNKPTNGSCITCCMKGRQKTAYGFKWEYA